ncbi:MAG TPA: hotdog domain-containing protein [Bacteroidales bacterium]|nr:hotdog domain-containing protein [Bacteroidales bacterium]HQI46312.1 hotdog domain-containing protein [Bacteroidales bacterium]
MNEMVRKSETRQFKVIFPNTLNDHDTLFGGIAMKWMDEVAYITAIRFTKKKMVTVSSERVQFLLPMKSGTIAEIIGKVTKVKTLKIEILVEIYIDDMYAENRQKAVVAIFTFAAINDENKPIPINMKTFLS